MGANKLNVLVGSKNPTKIKAVSEAFKRVFKKNNVVVSGVSVPSGVSDQPMGSKETKTGAENRLKNLKTHLADFYVGIEGGCGYQDKILYAFAWVVVENKKGRQGRGKTSMFQLPKKIKDIILYGSDDEEIKFSYDDGYEKYSHKKTFEGVINNLERRYLETDSDWKREEISQYQSDTKCERCNGHRLKDEALCVKINNLNISDDALIGAGAVLTKNTKKGGVYIGNPARITGKSSYSAFGIEAAIEVD